MSGRSKLDEVCYEEMAWDKGIENGCKNKVLALVIMTPYAD